jgi:hypothetical protein
MREAIHHVLTTDATLLGLLPAERWFARGAVEDSPKNPFAVLAWQGTVRTGRANHTGRLQLWVYQPRGSYDLIDSVLSRATEVLEELADFRRGGQHIAQVDFESDSVDLYDDMYRCNTRNAGYRVVGSGL